MRPTNSRATALFDAERSVCATSLPTGSRVLANRRVQTPASICSSTTRVNGSRPAKCAYVDRSISPPSTARTRGRGGGTAVTYFYDLRDNLTMLGGWAYGAIYRDSRQRTAALDGWLWDYNHHRPHSGVGRQTPITMLGTYT